MADPRTALGITGLISQLRQQSQATNPYLPFAQNVLSADTSSNDIGQSVGYGLAKSLLGGLALRLGQDSINDDVTSALKLTPSILGGQNIDTAGLDTNQQSYVSSLQALMQENALNRQLEDQDRLSKFTFDDELDRRKQQRSTENDLIKLKTEKPYLDNLFNKDGKQDLSFLSSKEKDSANIFADVPTLRQQEDERFKELLMNGYTPTQAATSARAEVETKRKLSKDEYESLAERDKTRETLGKIIDLGERGVAKAGQTGSKLASVYEKGMAILGNPEAIQQSEGDSLLDEAKGLSVAANRVPGTGGLSDFESRVLFNMGIGSDQLPEVNKTRISAMKAIKAKMDDYDSFVRTYLETTGGNPDRAKTLFKLYSEANPAVVTNQNGDVVPNPNRIPWQKFDFNKAYQQFQSGEAPTMNQGGGDSLQGAIPTGRVTKDGRPTYIIDGVEGVLE